MERRLAKDFMEMETSGLIPLFKSPSLCLSYPPHKGEQMNRLERAEQIRRKYELQKKGVKIPRRRPVTYNLRERKSAKCKYCGKETQLHPRAKTPVCKDQKCRRAYGVDRVMLCRRRKRERESREEN